MVNDFGKQLLTHNLVDAKRRNFLNDNNVRDKSKIIRKKSTFKINLQIIWFLGTSY